MITNHANRIHVYQDISGPFNQAHGPESIEGQNISNQDIRKKTSSPFKGEVWRGMGYLTADC